MAIELFIYQLSLCQCLLYFRLIKRPIYLYFKLDSLNGEPVVREFAERKGWLLETSHFFFTLDTYWFIKNPKTKANVDMP